MIANVVSVSSHNPDIARLIKWERLAVVRGLLPGHRVEECRALLVPGRQSVDVVYVQLKQQAHYRGLVVCGKYWVCPVCQARIAEYRREELARLVYAAPYRAVLVTFTLSHVYSDKLVKLLDTLKLATRSMRMSHIWRSIVSEFCIPGWITALEVLFGGYGWHPHLHELLLLRPDVDESDIKRLEETLQLLWFSCVKRLGRFAGKLAGVKITSHSQEVVDYIAKFGKEPADLHWGLSHEITGNVKKTSEHGLTAWQLVDEYMRGNKLLGRKFREYADAMQGKHSLGYSNGLRAKLLTYQPDPMDLQRDRPDLEIATNEPDEGVVLNTLSVKAWKVIRLAKAEAQLLNIAATGDIVAFHAFLSRLGIEFIDLSEF